MGAYVITDEWGEGDAVVRFAKHNVVARREGANALNCEFDEVSCRRFPRFDAYEDAGRVPVKVLLDAGWWISCAHCGNHVSHDGVSHEGEPLDPKLRGERVFCDQACLDIFAQNKADEHRREAVARVQFDMKFPSCELLSLSAITFHPQRKDELTTRVTFRFPGGKHAVDWYLGDETVSVHQPDVDAWQSYRAQRASSTTEEATA